MKAFSIFFLILGFSLTAWGQTPTLRSHFQDRSFVPGVLIPYQLKDGLVDATTKIVSIEKLGDVEADCRTMRDPFHPTIFHLKCAAPATVNLRIRFETQSRIYAIDYGPLVIAYPDPSLVPVDPGTTTSPDAVAGKSLYTAYCHACHINHSEKAGRTSAQIKNAINTNSSMKSIQDLKNLSADSLRKIEAYLKTTGGQ